jgi:hypothetical protein
MTATRPLLAASKPGSATTTSYSGGRPVAIDSAPAPTSATAMRSERGRATNATAASSSGRTPT